METEPARSWQDLNKDLLVEIFARADTESLAKWVPLVCKSWHHVSQNPHCWSNLVFTYDFCSFLIVFSCLQRSDNDVTSLVVPCYGALTHEEMVFLANRLPGLKKLYLNTERTPYVKRGVHISSDFISAFKNLEVLKFNGPCDNFRELLQTISIHSKNFRGLELRSFEMRGEDANALVEVLLGIKYLAIEWSELPKVYLMMVLIFEGIFRHLRS